MMQPIQPLPKPQMVDSSRHAADCMAMAEEQAAGPVPWARRAPMRLPEPCDRIEAGAKDTGQRNRPYAGIPDNLRAAATTPCSKKGGLF